MRKYIAEFLGTLGLTLVVLLSLNGVLSAVPTAVAAALTLGLFVYTVGHISGTHINPAITLGALSIRKISLRDAVFYILAQLLGAAAAFAIASQFLGERLNLAVAVDTPAVGLAELLGTFFFAFGVAAAIYGRAPADASGIVVGGSLLLGILFASTASNGVLNPAVAFGIGSLSWLYVLAPIVGAVLGMWVFKLLSHEKLKAR